MPNACRVEHNSSTISAATELVKTLQKSLYRLSPICYTPSIFVCALRSNTLRGERNIMKKPLLTLGPVLVFACTLLAVPLTALIFQESAKLADKVTVWNKQCGEKPWHDEVCLKKRSELSGQLGQFVALVNDELNSLRNISLDASPDFVREATGRRKIMELEVRNALHVIRCLGVPASDSECKWNQQPSKRRKPRLKRNTSRPTPFLMGTGFLFAPLSGPLPRNPDRRALRFWNRRTIRLLWCAIFRAMQCLPEK